MSTKIDVSTVAMHLAIAPKNPLASVIFTSLALEQRIPENIIKSIVTGVGAKMTHAYNYAKNSYTLGLPSGSSTQINIISDADLAALIALNIGELNGVVCFERGYEKYSPALRIIKFLVMTRQYQSTTGLIFNLPGYTDTNLYKVSISSAVVDGLNIIVTYSVYINTEVVPATVDPETSQVTPASYDWVLDTVSHTETVPIDNSFITTIDNFCFYSIYKKKDKNGTLLPMFYVWIYDLTTGLYPELDPILTTYTDDNYLPVVPIRYDNVDLTADDKKETPLYKTSKKLLDLLKIPFTFLGQQINANPDVASIDHAYIMWGVDLQTNESASLQYLNNFFHNIYVRNSINYSITRNQGENFLEHGLFLQIVYGEITSDIIEVPYVKGRKGTTTKQIQLGLDDILILDTKMSDTTIRRVTVHGLGLINYIYGDKYTGVNLRSVATNKDEHNLLIPIHYSIAHEMPLIQRNALYTDGSMMIINTVTKTKVEWYEEQWFSFVVIIIMVIVLVLTIIFTAGTTSAWWAALCANISAGLYGAAIISILMVVLPTLLIAYAANWLVTTYGAQWGAIGAVVMIAAAVVFQQYGVVLQITEMYALSMAQVAIQMGVALVSSANEFLIAEGQKAIDEYAAFNALMDVYGADLKAKQDLLEVNSDVDPLIYTRPPRLRIIPNESPDAFIQRCLGLVDNTMYILHDEIPNWFKHKLSLPRTVTPDMYRGNFGI